LIGKRGIIRVEHGKGGKERNVMLSAQLLAILGAIGSWRHPGSGCFRAGRDCQEFCA